MSKYEGYHPKESTDYSFLREGGQGLINNAPDEAELSLQDFVIKGRTPRDTSFTGQQRPPATREVSIGHPREAYLLERALPDEGILYIGMNDQAMTRIEMETVLMQLSLQNDRIGTSLQCYSGNRHAMGATVENGTCRIWFDDQVIVEF